MIINEDEILEDSLQTLIDNFGWSVERAKEVLDNTTMAELVGVMYEAQERFLEELNE